MITYLWTDTDLQIAGQGTAAPPSDDSYTVLPPVLAPPRTRFQSLVGWDEQMEMPLLLCIEDGGGWTPYITAPGTQIVRPDGTAWDNDFLPATASAPPTEDWDIIGILGLPVPIPPPRIPAPWSWHSEEREAAIAAGPDTDAMVMPWLLRVLPKAPVTMDVEGGLVDSDPGVPHSGGGGGSTVVQMITLQRLGDTT